ncbi:MAG: aminopeptidase P family protein, partial [Desulfobacterales bacterium]|nr:aminopeptidase P family protein [Desulfobacterales bacterium]
MNFIHSIKFRFTLWYLAVLAVLLLSLGSGVYFSLSRDLRQNLDNSLRTRAEQLSRFRDIISIVAGGTEGGDCHNSGTGQLRTGEPVIIDIFPRNRETLYNGDCTRTVVHGEIPDQIAKMHAVVVEAKAAAIAAVRPGVTGEDVHNATSDAITAHGYPMGLPPDDAPDTHCGMVHGTGHGVGLEVHEPPLLDKG